MKVGFKTPSDRQEARLNPHKKLTVIFKKVRCSEYISSGKKNNQGTLLKLVQIPEKFKRAHWVDMWRLVPKIARNRRR